MEAFEEIERAPAWLEAVIAELEGRGGLDDEFDYSADPLHLGYI